MLKIYALFALLFFTSAPVFSTLGMEDNDTKPRTFIDRFIKHRERRTGPTQKRIKKVLDTKNVLPPSTSSQEVIVERLIEVDDVIIKFLIDETAANTDNYVNARVLVQQHKDLFAMYKVNLKEKKQKKGD